jgi:hypothetical protein
LQRKAFVSKQVLVVADEENTVARCDSEQRDEANERGDAQSFAAQRHRGDPADQGERQIDQDDQRMTVAPERQEQEAV